MVIANSGFRSSPMVSIRQGLERLGHISPSDLEFDTPKERKSAVRTASATLMGRLLNSVASKRRQREGEPEMLVSGGADYEMG